ncbi:MAG: hypothetical protein M9894_11585 [Planctomycetes bacterium]|nr:hypothetical protein [Planctomycetota bacterium]
MTTAYALQPGATVVITPPGGEEPVELELLTPLGRGANSQTWLARSDGATFAVKAPLADGDDHELTIEERIVQQFHHPSVVALAGSGVGPGGRLVLAYERLFPNPLNVVNRPSVRRHFPGDPGTRFYPLPPPVALNLAVDLLAALEHVHRRGFVHHDVKPDNLMVRAPLPPDAAELPDHELLELALRGECQGVLVDLGSSRSNAYLAELNRGGIDADVLVVPPQLTPLNAPPEALLDNDVPGGRPRPLLFRSLDVYAAALTIYAMVSGRSPYDHLGLDTASFEALRRVKAAERAGELVPFSAEAVSGAPGYRRVADDLLALLLACTHRDPAERPGVAGALQFVEELQRAFSPATRERAARERRLGALAATEADREDMFFGVTAQARSTARARAWELRRAPT